MKRSRLTAGLLAALLLFALILPAHALEEPVLTCRAAILVDGDNDEVLFEHDAYERMYPASITKIMTSLLVLEAVERGELSMDMEIAASESAIAAITEDSSTQNIKVGEVLTLRELLYCDLVASANEACNILAETVGGSMEEFVGMMNRRAAELGMEDTHFVNPNGLHDPQHYTTAYDIYLMAREAMGHEEFRTIVSTAVHEVPATEVSGARTLRSTNSLLTNSEYSYPKAIGIKTGSTSAAGYCLASAATDSSGRTFYCVVLGAQNVRNEDDTITRYSFKESRELLEWGFSGFKRITLLDESSELREVEVTLSDEQDHVLVQPQGSIQRTMPVDYDPEKVELLVEGLPESMEAPVSAGTRVGTVTVMYEGENYGTLDLVTVSDVARSEMQYYVKTAKDYLDTWWVRGILIAAAVLVVLVCILVGVARSRRRRERRGRSYHYSGNRRRRY